MKIIVRWLLLAAALLLVAYLYPGVSVKSFGSAMLAAFVLGLLNTLLRPILVLLTLAGHADHVRALPVRHQRLHRSTSPRRCSRVSTSTGFVAALIGSLVYSLCGMVIDLAMERMFSRS